MHDDKQGTKNGALGNTTGGGTQGRKSVKLHLTLKERNEKYDLNQVRTEPWIPNQEERQVSKMMWSMVSKAAERSRRYRHDNFCDPIH